MKPNGERGFTLIELMIVMVVIGVLASLALPNLSAVFSRDHLRGSTSSVTSALYLARTKAVNDGTPYGVQFNANGRFYVVSDPKTTPVRFGPPYHLDEGIEFVENTFVDSLAIFNEYGQLDKSCLSAGEMIGTIMISNSPIDTTRVEVTFISGRIRETNL